jgi:hypothetical protein
MLSYSSKTKEVEIYGQLLHGRTCRWIRVRMDWKGADVLSCHHELQSSESITIKLSLITSFSVILILFVAWCPSERKENDYAMLSTCVFCHGQGPVPHRTVNYRFRFS